jgi:hypothetical protein
MERTPISNPGGALRVAALAFACLIGIMWGAYGPGCGMPYETAFPYSSETSSALRGFLYSDVLRVHTNTFYHLSYLIGKALGIRGSYVPYQVVYALLWWARGMLVFAILRRFLPGCLSLCYTAGAFVVIHSSDGATLLVGQMNQSGYIFWMLLAMYCFVRAWDSTRWLAAVSWALAATAFEYMSLWSYESQILLILLFPAITMLARREWRKPARLIAWYSVPATYFVYTYLKYAHSGGQTYQESVLRKSWGLASIAADWSFNIGASLSFWDWERLGWRTPRSEAHLLSAIAAAVFVVGWVAMIRLGEDRSRPNPFAESFRGALRLLAVGLVTLALSFPVYLVLINSRGLWRTQILSGIGSGIVLAAVVGLISCVPLGKAGRIAVVFTAGAAIVYYGSVAAIEKGGVHRWNWEYQRTAMVEILRLAPNVQPGTVIVMTNVPKSPDPFDHTMWFDMALRLAYPGVPVAGAYFFEDGSPGPGNDLVLTGATWRWDGKGFARLFSAAPLDKTLVVEYGASGTGKLLSALPAFICQSTCAGELYHPDHAIDAGAVSPIAARRYTVPLP